MLYSILASRRLTIPLAILAGASFLSCATTNEVYMHPLADPAALERVAILPFENLSGDGRSPNIVEEAFLLSFLQYGGFEVVDPGEVRSASEDLGLRAGRIDREALHTIRERLGCDAVLTGTVVIYDRNTPEISLSARLIETEEGVIIWAADMGRVGRTDLPTFGVGETTSIRRLAQKVVDEMARSLLG